MNTPRFQVDTVNAIIRGVSVITSGLVARGHELHVDATTLQQMKSCGDARGRTPVKVDHKSGAGAVVGYLENFRIEGNQLLADWHLLQSHPQTAQILETAQRMPEGVGLSAAFISPDNAEPGKARCSELLSVDFVALPAANPRGLFGRATINGKLVEFSFGPDLLRAGKLGLARGLVGAGVKLKNTKFVIPKVTTPLTRRAILDGAKGAWQENKSAIKGIGGGLLRDAAVVTGAGLLANAIQKKQQEVEDRLAARRARQRHLSTKIDAILLSRRDPALHRVVDATRDNLPEYEEPTQVSVARKIWRSDIARAARLRLAKAGALSLAGGYAAHRLLKPKGAWKIGAVGGAAAGLLFNNQTPMVTFSRPESHSAHSLAKRLKTGVPMVLEMQRRGILRGREFIRGNSAVLAFDAEHLNQVALAMREEEASDHSTLGKLAKGAAVTGGALAGSAWLRGRIAVGADRAGSLGLAKTAVLGGRRAIKDVASLIKLGRQRLAAM